MKFERIDGRTFDSVRPINLKFDALGYADASVLLEIGNTKVFVAVSFQNKVPPFLKGSNTGWLTAEYAMLPCATQKRTIRDSNQIQKNSRSVEISRLIGRSLRTVVDLTCFGEKTIIVDCDVLQADGGTRVACITAANLALKLAEKRWFNAGLIQKNILKDSIAAISVGLVQEQPILDLSYEEDSQANSDFNFILTKSGKIIEIQGTSEKEPLEWNLFEELKKLAIKGIEDIFVVEKDELKKLNDIAMAKDLSDKEEYQIKSKKDSHKKQSFFSLQNRVSEKSI
ncbi:MAG: ribonuclease PH [bacterium]